MDESDRGPASLRADRGSLRLGWDLTSAGEPMVGLMFDQVRAYKHRSDGECTAWHWAAYGKLVEVESSAWIDELLKARLHTEGPLWHELHHFMIYVEDDGCYEVAAARWRLIPPQPGLDGRPLPA